MIIDESQRMDQALLEEIRLLSNIEKQSAKLVNIFFVGQAEFNSIILEERNRALRQRIAVNYDLGPVSRRETDLYVRHRLKVAGTEKRIFTSAAIKEVHAFSEGYPRLINVICDRALVTGYANGSATISGAVIRECADEMQLHKPGNPKKKAKAGLLKQALKKAALQAHLLEIPEAEAKEIFSSFYRDIQSSRGGSDEK